jgi:hypothetical protein
VPLWPLPYVELLPGVELELLELVFGLFCAEVDEVFDCPLRSLPIDEVSVEEPVPVEPLIVPCVPLVEPLTEPWLPEVEPCAVTCPWLPAALWVPSTVPCVVVPVDWVLDAVRVSFCDPEHAPSSAAAPSAVTK